MVKILSRLNPRVGAKRAAQQVRDAINAAKGRTGGEGRLVAISAGGFLLAFVLLAALAPILITSPPFLSSVIGFILLALVIGATGIGGVALWRMIKAGAMEGTAATSPTSTIYSQSAVEAALSDAEDAGLRAVAPRIIEDAMTGRVSGRPISVVRADGVTYGVVRLKEAIAGALLVAPGSSPWPFAFPNDGALTPISAPGGVKGLAWTTARETGLAVGVSLGPALAMSEAGGEVPYLSVRGRALVMMWRKGDVGTACLIVGEVAKLVSRE
jgi:hypothetical protein